MSIPDPIGRVWSKAAQRIHQHDTIFTAGFYELAGLPWIDFDKDARTFTDEAGYLATQTVYN